MDANRILNVLVEALRNKRGILETQIAALNTEKAKLTERQRGIGEQLRKKSAEHEAITEDRIQSFFGAWILRGRHDPIPCPICFCLGREAKLIALPGNDQFEPLKCKSCGEVFEIPAG